MKKEEKKYHYLIAYNFRHYRYWLIKPGVSKYYTNKKINTIERIMEIQEKIRKKHNHNKVIIFNFFIVNL